MISPSVNSNIVPSRTILTYPAAQKITKILAYTFTIAGVIALIAAAIFQNFVLLCTGGAFLAISMPINFVVLKLWFDTRETRTGGEPTFFELPRKPFFESDAKTEVPVKTEDDIDLSIIIEHPKGELKEVSDALLQEVDQVLQAITPIETDSPGRPETPPAPASTPQPVAPAAPKKPAATGWSIFATKKAD